LELASSGSSCLRFELSRRATQTTRANEGLQDEMYVSMSRETIDKGALLTPRSGDESFARGKIVLCAELRKDCGSLRATRDAIDCGTSA